MPPKRRNHAPKNCNLKKILRPKQDSPQIILIVALDFNYELFIFWGRLVTQIVDRKREPMLVMNASEIMHSFRHSREYFSCKLIMFCCWFSGAIKRNAYYDFGSYSRQTVSLGKQLSLMYDVTLPFCSHFGVAFIWCSIISIGPVG